jgi:hypothetical protein
MGLRDGVLWDQAFVQAHFPDRASYGRFVWAYVIGEARLPDDLERYLRSLDA